MNFDSESVCSDLKSIGLGERPDLLSQLTSKSFRGAIVVDGDALELGSKLVNLAARFSVAPISGFYVGAVAIGESGRMYLGANMEFSGVPLSASLHAEQSAVLNAWFGGESRIDHIFVSAPPCGHCRQFMSELPGAGGLQISFEDKAHSLASLLPYAFDGLENGDQSLFRCPEYGLEPIFPDQPKLAKLAIQAARMSYTPYSNSPEGVAIECVNGSTFTGRTAESAAFNPTISAAVCALNQRNFSHSRTDAINGAVHAKIPTSIVGQRDLTKSLLRRISNVEVQAVAMEMA